MKPLASGIPDIVGGFLFIEEERVGLRYFARLDPVF